MHAITEYFESKKSKFPPDRRVYVRTMAGLSLVLLASLSALAGDLLSQFGWARVALYVAAIPVVIAGSVFVFGGYSLSRSIAGSYWGALWVMAASFNAAPSWAMLIWTIGILVLGLGRSFVMANR